jgi:hypothetical protein
MSALRSLRRKLRLRYHARSVTKLLVRMLPAPAMCEVVHRRARRRRRTKFTTERDVRWIEVDHVARIATYWSDVPDVGTGPSASVFVLDEEVLRLDCFGGGRGHMHLNPEQIEALAPRTPRIFLGTGTVESEIERARYEVVFNTEAAVLANGLRRVRRHRLDHERLMQAADEMHHRMAELVQARR